DITTILPYAGTWARSCDLADFVAGGAQRVFDSADAQRAEVEDACCEYGVRAGIDRGREVSDCACSPGRDHGYVDDPPHRRDHLEVVAASRAVSIHRVEQDLPHA